MTPALKNALEKIGGVRAVSKAPGIVEIEYSETHTP